MTLELGGDGGRLTRDLAIWPVGAQASHRVTKMIAGTLFSSVTLCPLRARPSVQMIHTARVPTRHTVSRQNWQSSLPLPE
jgi:hypothetical protein